MDPDRRNAIRISYWIQIALTWLVKPIVPIYCRYPAVKTLVDGLFFLLNWVCVTLESAGNAIWVSEFIQNSVELTFQTAKNAASAHKMTYQMLGKAVEFLKNRKFEVLDIALIALMWALCRISEYALDQLNRYEPPFEGQNASKNAENALQIGWYGQKTATIAGTMCLLSRVRWWKYPVRLMRRINGIRDPNQRLPWPCGSVRYLDYKMFILGYGLPMPRCSSLAHMTKASLQSSRL